MSLAPISRTDFDALKTCVEFDLPEDRCPTQEGRKHLDWTLEVLGTIVTGVSTKEYRMTKLKAVHGMDVGYRCRLGRCCEISMFLGVERKRTGHLSCFLGTHWFAPLPLLPFQRRVMPSSNCVDHWMRFCGALNDILGTLGATSVAWLTQKESDALEPAE